MAPFKIFGDDFEQGALDQFNSALEQPFAVRGALMPDAHQGYSLPIGAVVATDGVVLPSWVGYDIGCGMCALPTTFDHREICKHRDAIMHEIYKHVPVGFKHNESPCYPSKTKIQNYLSEAGADIFAAKGGYKQLGTLGGGNHFIEIGADERDRVWIIVHSGSRGIGHGIASHYMRLASPTGKASEGHFGFTFDSQEGRDYLLDQEFCLTFALENRWAIIQRTVWAITRYAEGEECVEETINRNHNHVERKDDVWIHRKGATHAEEGMMGVIPGNMRDGSYIVRGKGNPDALWSSSHGAGRAMSRTAARKSLLMEDFKIQMEGISAKVTKATLDESPGAYKDLLSIMTDQEELVEAVHCVVPIINVKG